MKRRISPGRWRVAVPARCIRLRMLRSVDHVSSIIAIFHRVDKVKAVIHIEITPEEMMFVDCFENFCFENVKILSRLFELLLIF